MTLTEKRLQEKKMRLDIIQRKVLELRLKDKETYARKWVSRQTSATRHGSYVAVNKEKERNLA